MRRSPWWIGLVLLGCSSSSGRNDLDPQTKLEAAADDRQDELCRSLDAMREDDRVYLARSCTAHGVLMSNRDGGTCRQHRDDCIKDPPRCNTDIFEDIPDLECPDATVGMFLDCMRGGLRLTKELYEELTCETEADEVTTLIIEAVDEFAFNPPAECQEFMEACPAFYEDRVEHESAARNLSPAELTKDSL